MFLSNFISLLIILQLLYFALKNQISYHVQGALYFLVPIFCPLLTKYLLNSEKQYFNSMGSILNRNIRPWLKVGGEKILMGIFLQNSWMDNSIARGWTIIFNELWLIEPGIWASFLLSWFLPSYSLPTCNS